MTDTEQAKVLRDLAGQSNDGVLRGPAFAAAEKIDALLAENERLRSARPAPTVAEAAKVLLDELNPNLDALPPGPWETWTSCSFRRISGPDGKDGGVLHATKHKYDGHPDLSWTERQCDAICAIVNTLRALSGDAND